MSGSQVVLEIHSLVVDGEIIDRRHCKYRTASGRIRPYFTFCLAPKACLVMSLTLSADRPDQRSLAALLYAAILQSQEKPYGGIPDEIWLYSQIPVLYKRPSKPWAFHSELFPTSFLYREERSVSLRRSKRMYGRPYLTIQACKGHKLRKLQGVSHCAQWKTRLDIILHSITKGSTAG